MDIRTAADCANRASIPLAAADTALKNRALGVIADALTARCDEIVAANRDDLQQAQASASEFLGDGSGEVTSLL